MNNCNCELCYFGLYLTFDITSRRVPSLLGASGGANVLTHCIFHPLPFSLLELTFSAEIELREEK